jgi:hypothetical protein
LKKQSFPFVKFQDRRDKDIIKHIWSFSKLHDIDIQVIIDVIKKELNQTTKQVKKSD